MIVRYLAQAWLSLTFLPYEAFFSLDAVVRAGWRMLFTHKLLLEWNSSSSSKSSGKNDLAGICRSMWIAPAVAIAMGSYLAFWRPDVLHIVWPLLVSWSLAPVVAWWISLPLETPRAKLSEDQMIFLRKVSRKTWKFFETFVGPESHWLPPDNYQEKPLSVVANGTSPTNMGLALLANLAAYDFGYISAGTLIKRTGSSLQTMKNLERFQGHFYNWYDIKLQEPMQPRYISTVDSGNLAGHLLTLQQGLFELPDQKILPDQVFEGLTDTLHIILDIAVRDGPLHESQKEIMPMQVQDQIRQFKNELLSPPSTLLAAWMMLDKQARAVAGIIDSLSPEVDDNVKSWILAYEKQIQDYLDDLIQTAPWLMLPLWVLIHPIKEDVLTSHFAKEARRMDELHTELLKLDSIPSLLEVPEMAMKLKP